MKENKDKIDKINKYINDLIEQFQNGDDTAYIKLQTTRDILKILKEEK